jgi:ABC-type multidrug transport system ATPase subunit
MPFLRIFAVKAEEASERTSRLLENSGLSELGEADVEGLTALDKRRVALLRALVNEPDFLLIEEIDQHLEASDPEGFFETLRMVAAGRTIVATASDPRVAAHADHVVAMDEGTVVADTQSVSG